MGDFRQRNKDLQPNEAAPYLSAAEAARRLEVKRATLYTYVSRGLIRSVARPDSKARLYAAEDVERVRGRADARLGAAPSAEGAMRWGQPVINTAITEITPEGPRYRGENAIELARRGRSFESVAELLWTGMPHHAPLAWEADAVPADFRNQLDALVLRGPRPPMLRILAIATTLLGAAEGASTEIQRGTTVPAARQLILTHAGCLGYLAPTPGFRAPKRGERMAEHVSRALGVAATDGKGGERGSAAAPARAANALAALDAALVLCADHELSSATFAARVAASAGAELRACILAAIGTHSGVRLGGGCDRVEDLLAGATTAEGALERLAAAEGAGDRVPGFSIVAYPKGDPRARQLVATALALAGPGTRGEAIARAIADAERALALRPSIEAGLVALAAALELPPRAAGALWAIGRSAGWIAHIMEQRLAGFVVRPRARFVGAG